MIVGSCLLFLLCTAIYFFVTDAYTEANFGTSKGFSKGDRLNGMGIFFLFVCMAALYIIAILEDRKIRKTKYRK